MQDLLFIVGFAALNRFSGGGLGWEHLARDHGGAVPGRPIYYAALASIGLALACGVALGGALWIFVSFLTYRLPGWYRAIDGGTHDGTPEGDFVLMFARTLFAFPVFAVAAYDVRSIWPAALLFLVSVLCAAAYHIGARAPGWARRFFPAEWMAGALLGAGFYIAAH